MNHTIKAIETRYKGYRFRSRLEARYAIFFDALGLRWQYEPEGFDLGDLGWYLPDFYLPDWDIWLEVKPDVPTDKEMARFTAFHMAMAQEKAGDGIGGFNPSYILCGTPGVPHIELGEVYGQWKLVSGSIALHPVALKENGVNEAGLGLLKLASPSDKDAELVCTVEAFAFVNGGRELDIWPIYVCGIDAAGPTTMKMLHMHRTICGPKTNLYLSLRFPQGTITRSYGGKGISFDNMALRTAYTAARSARFEHGESPA